MSDRHESDANDVEKNWHDPKVSRHAMILVGVVLMLALGAMVVFGLWTGDGRDGLRYLVSVVPGAIMVVGTLAAFWQTFRCWRRHGAWPIWQGAGWFLLTASLVYMAISVGFAGTPN